MSLYHAMGEKPASRVRAATSRDVFSSPDSANRVVPKNPKFANVKATINTGANTGNVKVKVDRSGEMFRRVNRRQLHHLMLACEKGDESIYELQENWDNVEDMDDTMSLPASTASDHFLLLDMRDDDDAFKRYHIQGAIHYPPALLRRDHFPPALYAMKNAPNKLIILYDSDETARLALDSCALFIQKGFSNTLLLTGGLKHFAEKYLSRVVGESPPKPKPSAASAQSMSSSSRSQALAGTPAGRLNTGMSSSSSMAASSRLHTGSVSSRPSARAAPQTPGMQSHSATSLGYTQARERESPRDTLGRAQQQHQAPPSGSSSRSTRPDTTSREPISSRAFR